jgi:multiple sugar transport system ATP-binding protein
MADVGVAGQLVVVEPMGAETEILVDVGGVQLTVTEHHRVTTKPGETVHLAVDTAHAHLFDTASGERLD